MNYNSSSCFLFLSLCQISSNTCDKDRTQEETIKLVELDALHLQHYMSALTTQTIAKITIAQGVCQHTLV